MIIEKELESYRPLLTDLEIYKIEYDCLRNTNISAINYDAVNVQTSNITSMVENKVILIEKEMPELLNKIIATEAKINIIEKLIQGLDDEEEITVINGIYRDGKQYYKLSSQLFKSEKTIKRIKKRALRKLDVMYRRYVQKVS